jgi:ABC-type proline/glycine betaine transport system ATPase subunit
MNMLISAFNIEWSLLMAASVMMSVPLIIIFAFLQKLSDPRLWRRRREGLTTGRGRFRKVRKAFGDTVAVEGWIWRSNQGEFVSLLGPSGCGKTTTLRMLAGLEFPTSGEIRIGDRVVNDLAPGARDIAMVFQSYALYPHMTVAENIAYPLKKRGVPRRRNASKLARAPRCCS